MFFTLERIDVSATISPSIGEFDQFDLNWENV